MAVPMTVTPQFHTLCSLPCIMKPKLKSREKVSIRSSSTLHTSLSDPFVLELAEALEDSLSPSSIISLLPLQKLRDTSSQLLLSTQWPSRKDEPFRFIDTSFLRQSQINPISRQISPLSISWDTELPNLVIVDGHLHSSFSNLSGLPDNVYVGSLSSLSSEIIMKKVGDYVSGLEGDLFWLLNGVGTPDLIVVFVPPGCQLETPLQLRYYSVESADGGSKKFPISNPRVLVLVEKGGEIDIVEEYMGSDNQCYWANSVTEMVVGEGGKVRHTISQSQSLSAAHTKWTSVQQESASTYELIEISTGGRLSRHNLHVQQIGPDTKTMLSTLHLSVSDQTQDLHSRIVLDHPRGYSRQLHKCIVAHSSGQAVFDGNIKVNRFAQQADAGQLTRTLLLEPRATVNVKPNLQIIADDVKCSHGAAISDLEEDQLFYFLSRGIDLETAKKALIFSFAAEVIERLPYLLVRDKAKNHIKNLLESALK